MASMNKKLGNFALKEIRESIERCGNSREISAEAERLSKLNGVSKSRIYELTEDIRPKRKTRADKGKRVAPLMETEGLKFAAAWVIEHNADPAYALETARARGYDIPVELSTFVRYLNEHGLNRKNRRTNRSNHRRFEAKAPGDVFQFDISGTKERWFDTSTRRIVKVTSLEVSKNHPNEKKNRVKVWRFVLVDDFSRMRFIRFVAADKPDSSHVVAFLLEAYQEMGVPKILYTDNDAIIKFGRNKRASEVLHRALESIGGYSLEQHLPGNSRATGKVEVAHQWVEKVEKLLGLFLAEGRDLTMEVMNRIAVNDAARYNNRIHRETGEKPIVRWNSQRHLIRTVDAALLTSAFLVDEMPILINGDLTFSYKGVKYQLPTDQGFQNLIACQSAKNKCKVVISDADDFYILVDFNGKESPPIPKQIAGPDVFGEFKSTAEDFAERTRKELKAFAKQNAKAEKELNRQGAAPKPIAVIDTEFVSEKTNVASFPPKTVDVTPQIIESMPTSQRIAAAGYAGHLLSFYDAVRAYSDRFESVAACKAYFDSIYASRDDFQPEAVILDSLDQPERPKLRAVS